MYEHAAALEMIHRRELLLRRMRQQGILALELAPGGLSTALVNHYLETKERGLLLACERLKAVVFRNPKPK